MSKKRINYSDILATPNDNTWTPLLKGEKHPPLYDRFGELSYGNYVGPGTQALKRIKRGDRARTLVDRIAEEHDIRYTIGSTAKDIHTADIIMLDELENLNKVHGDWYANIMTGKMGIGSKRAIDKTISKLKGKDYSMYLPKSELSDEDRKLLNDRLDTLLMENAQYHPYTREDRTHGGLYNDFYKNTKSESGAYPSRSDAAKENVKKILNYLWENKEDAIDIIVSVASGKFVQKYVKDPVNKFKDNINTAKQQYKIRKGQLKDLFSKIKSKLTSGGKSPNEMVDAELEAFSDELLENLMMTEGLESMAPERFVNADDENLPEISEWITDEINNTIAESESGQTVLDDVFTNASDNINIGLGDDDILPGMNDSNITDAIDTEIMPTETTGVSGGLGALDIGNMGLSLAIGTYNVIDGAVKKHEHNQKVEKARKHIADMFKKYNDRFGKMYTIQDMLKGKIDSDLKEATNNKWNNNDRSSGISLFMKYGPAAVMMMEKFNKTLKSIKSIKDDDLRTSLLKDAGEKNWRFLQDMEKNKYVYDMYQNKPGASEEYLNLQHRLQTEFAPDEYHAFIEDGRPKKDYTWNQFDADRLYSEDDSEYEKATRYFLGRYGESPIFQDKNWYRVYSSKVDSYFTDQENDIGKTIYDKHQKNNQKNMSNNTKDNSMPTKNGDDQLESGIANDGHNKNQKKPGSGLDSHHNTINGSGNNHKRHMNDKQHAIGNGLNSGINKPGTLHGKDKYQPQNPALAPVGDQYHHMNYVPTANAIQENEETTPDSTVEAPIEQKVRDDMFLYTHDITPSNQETLMAQAKASFMQSKRHNDALG
jgi:hypothetical protein